MVLLRGLMREEQGGIAAGAKSSATVPQVAIFPAVVVIFLFRRRRLFPCHSPNLLPFSRASCGTTPCKIMAGPFKLPNKAEAEAEKKKRVSDSGPEPSAPRAPSRPIFLSLPRCTPRFGPRTRD